VNHTGGDMDNIANPVYPVNADNLAAKIEDLRAVNLIMLGYAMAVISKIDDQNGLFCSIGEIRSALEKRLASRSGMLGLAIDALETGYISHGV